MSGGSDDATRDPGGPHTDRGPRVFRHTPVMLAEVVALFAAVPPGVVIDATVGGAGHSEAILDARDDLTVLGIDRDPHAIDEATRRLRRFGGRARVVRGRFADMTDAVRELDVDHVSGVLMDLGVSSPQLDHPERGFSHSNEAVPDLRMDPDQPFSALDVVNGYSAAELADVIRRYGEERYAGRIAHNIVAGRPIESTTRLAGIVAESIPAPARRKGGHPARRTFQALRVETNDELGQLADALDEAIDLLLPGGRAVVISYHSLEDRIVKERFRRAETGDCRCPPGLDCVCGARPRIKLLGRRARPASAEEIERNPRSRSAKRRAVEALPLDDAEMLPLGGEQRGAAS
ncbi:MAG: 16S rRNA (cytosine(1402)-N(4))-methyltransferase RsmH [Microthrixaceae bacterium]